MLPQKNQQILNQSSDLDFTPIVSPKANVLIEFENGEFYNGYIGNSLGNAEDNGLVGLSVSLSHRGNRCSLEIFDPDIKIAEKLFGNDINHSINIFFNDMFNKLIVEHKMFTTGYNYDENNKTITIYGQQKTIVTKVEKENIVYENLTLKQLVNIAAEENEFDFLNMNDDRAVYEHFPVRNASLWEVLKREFDERGYTYYVDNDAIYVLLLTKDSFRIATDILKLYNPTKYFKDIFNAPNGILFSYTIEGSEDTKSSTSASNKSNIIEVKRILNPKTGEFEDTAIRKIKEEKTRSKKRKSNKKASGTKGNPIPTYRPVYVEKIKKSQLETDAKNKLSALEVDDVSISFDYPISKSILRLNPLTGFELVGFGDVFDDVYKIDSIDFNYSSSGYTANIVGKKPVNLK